MHSILVPPPTVDDDDAPGGAEAADLADSELRPLAFEAADDGLRLDQALVRHVQGLSRNYLRQLIEEGAVALHGRVVLKPAHRVKAGDTGNIELRPTPQSQAFVPEAIDLPIVHRDEHLLVINKPAGLVVHPAPGNWRGTVLNALLAMDPQAMLLPRAGIVHRLDKDTSGLMVVARTRACMDALVAALAARQVSRQYLAISAKPWSGAEHRTVDLPIGRDVKNRLRMAVVDLDKLPGKPARTDMDRLDSNSHGCLARCKLHTGRTHQIRVHMAHIHLPLAGDSLYGGAQLPSMPRQALHAAQLAFTHPITGVEMQFAAPLPDDMVALLLELGLKQP
jgi:23S rRNA pseudouridine1911/1915/1917 synthase